MLGHAFGIDVDTSFPIPELPVRGGRDGFPRTRLEAADARRLQKDWPADEGRKVVDRTFPDGSPMLVVERHEQGFHVWAPRYGRHAVSGDGGRVWSAVPRVPAWRWERLLFAQVLPLAAALCGRELFHASAVALEGGAIAFVGLSGAGKSSVAAHLVARGALLVTDDVLALTVEPRADGVRAHSGTRLVGLDTNELATMTTAGRALFGAVLGRSDKAYLAVPVVDSSLPLRALYFLGRNQGREIDISPSEALASLLLGSSFLSYLDSSERLVRHLDVCARIAETVPTHVLTAPAAAGAKGVAAAIEAHALAVIRGGS
jgi:hypothetical protein